MQRQRRTKMWPSRYKPDQSGSDEDRVIDKATWLPKPDRIDDAPSKRARW
jgi:hypothetical protein